MGYGFQLALQHHRILVDGILAAERNGVEGDGLAAYLLRGQLYNSLKGKCGFLRHKAS